MATPAHVAYCFETLSSSLDKRASLDLSTTQDLWAAFTTDDKPPAAASTTPRDPAVTRIVGGGSGDASSDSSSSGPVSAASSTPSLATASSGTSASSNSSSGRKRGAEEEHPLFITWDTRSRSGSKSLRGCIGTFEAQPLAEGLRNYALTAAFDDMRFSPITARELPSLQCTVTLLTDFEPVGDALDWAVGTHGLRISFTSGGRRYGSCYLPEVAREQGWSREETLVSLMRKAGWNGSRAEWRRVRLNVVRFQGKAESLTYAEWKAWRDWVGKRGNA